MHVTDATNAAVTAVRTIDWDDELLKKAADPAAVLPAIVDSSGAVGAATALQAHLRHRRRPAGIARGTGLYEAPGP